MLKIFVGFDERQRVSFTTLATSIFETASRPVSVSPLVLRHLADHPQRADALHLFKVFSAVVVRLSRQRHFYGRRYVAGFRHYRA